MYAVVSFTLLERDTGTFMTRWSYTGTFRTRWSSTGTFRTRWSASKCNKVQWVFSSAVSRRISLVKRKQDDKEGKTNLDTDGHMGVTQSPYALVPQGNAVGILCLAQSRPR